MTEANQSQPASESAARFTQAWKAGIDIAGPSLFGCQAASPEQATHWHQLTPKLDVMRKELPNRSQSDAAFAGALASFFNAEEGHKLMKKAGCESFGHLAYQLDPVRRAVLADLLASFGGW